MASYYLVTRFYPHPIFDYFSLSIYIEKLYAFQTRFSRTCQLRPKCRFSRFCRRVCYIYLQCGRHHLQLADLLRVGQGTSLMGVTACFIRALFERGQLNKRSERHQRKILSSKRQCHAVFQRVASSIFR